MKIPCEDCITFAVCKIENETKDKVFYINPKLLEKCSLISSYIENICSKQSKEIDVLKFKKMVEKIKNLFEG